MYLFLLIQLEEKKYYLFLCRQVVKTDSDRFIKSNHITIHMSTKKFLLQEKDIPTAWYNIVADMKNKPRPMLNPATKQPLKEEDLYPLFSKGVSHQEMNETDAWIEIPEEVRDLYKVWRPTPLVRAYGLEKALDTPAHIYFKNESVSPVGSHKLNSALAQAYYCKKEGVTNITTETGAGQ